MGGKKEVGKTREMTVCNCLGKNIWNIPLRDKDLTTLVSRLGGKRRKLDVEEERR